MKKIILVFLFLNLFLTPSYSFDLFKNNDNLQIRMTLMKHNRALSNHNTKEVKAYYDSEYKSTDGFNLDELAQMLDKTFASYKNIKYKTKINSINSYGTWALVNMQDKTWATVYPVEDKKIKKEKSGKLLGRSVYNVYLKKDNNSWKIVSDDVLMEETTLKYGISKDIKMDLITPYSIKPNQQYDLSLKIDTPEDILALASISREEVIYPPKDYQEKFRKIPESGDLERVVKANNKNLDEYAVASLGFTKVSVSDNGNRAKIEVLGMAYMMKRIKMETIKKVNTKKAEK